MAKKPKHKSDSTEPSGEAGDILDQFDNDLRELGNLEEDAEPGRGAARPSLDDRLKVFEELLKITAQINSTHDWVELVRRIVDAVVMTTDCDRGFLMLRDRDGRDTFAIGRTKDKQELGRDAFKVSGSVVQKAMETGKPVTLGDVGTSDEIKFKESVVILKIKSVFCVPLKYDDRPIGAIYVDSERLSPRFGEKDVFILEAFGAQAAVAIENARRLGQLEDDMESLKKELAGQYEFAGIIGQSEAMIKVIERMQQVAKNTANVHISGASGTGKSMIARAIHNNSTRKDRPFQVVECGSLHEQLLQSELFGHVKGAYTGADKDRVGMFEQANTGTLLLEEIGELPLNLQPELLRAVQENEIRRVGDNKFRKIDVRIISATNRDLEREVKEGRFRQDLYYRLVVVPIVIPPLKERPEDILPLAKHYLKQYSKAQGITAPKLDRTAWELLMMYGWPGNVRELQNLIQRILALHGEAETVSAADIEPYLPGGGYLKNTAEGATLKDQMIEVETEFIRKALVKHAWNVAGAARDLGISRQALYTKMDKFGLSQDA